MTQTVFQLQNPQYHKSSNCLSFCLSFYYIIICLSAMRTKSGSHEATSTTTINPYYDSSITSCQAPIPAISPVLPSYWKRPQQSTACLYDRSVYFTVLFFLPVSNLIRSIYPHRYYCSLSLTTLSFVIRYIGEVTDFIIDKTGSYSAPSPCSSNTFIGSQRNIHVTSYHVLTSWAPVTLVIFSYYCTHCLTLSVS